MNALDGQTDWSVTMGKGKSKAELAVLMRKWHCNYRQTWELTLEKAFHQVQPPELISKIKTKEQPRR